MVRVTGQSHYNDVIMSVMASQVTSLTVVYSTVYSGADQRQTSKLSVTGLYEGNSPVTGEFPTQRTSNAENVFIWWRHHDIRVSMMDAEGQAFIWCQDISNHHGGLWTSRQISWVHQRKALWFIFIYVWLSQILSNVRKHSLHITSSSTDKKMCWIQKWTHMNHQYLQGQRCQHSIFEMGNQFQIHNKIA